MLDLSTQKYRYISIIIKNKNKIEIYNVFFLINQKNIKIENAKTKY